MCNLLSCIYSQGKTIITNHPPVPTNAHNNNSSSSPFSSHRLHYLLNSLVHLPLLVSIHRAQPTYMTHPLTVRAEHRTVFSADPVSAAVLNVSACAASSVLRLWCVDVASRRRRMLLVGVVAWVGMKRFSVHLRIMVARLVSLVAGLMAIRMMRLGVTGTRVNYLGGVVET